MSAFGGKADTNAFQGTGMDTKIRVLKNPVSYRISVSRKSVSVSYRIVSVSYLPYPKESPSLGSLLLRNGMALGPRHLGCHLMQGAESRQPRRSREGTRSWPMKIENLQSSSEMAVLRQKRG